MRGCEFVIATDVQGMTTSPARARYDTSSSNERVGGWPFDRNSWFNKANNQQLDHLKKVRLKLNE